MSLYGNLCTSLYRIAGVRRLLISVLPSRCTGQQPLPLASACALCARACTNMLSSCSTHLLISLPWPVHRYWEVLFFMPVYILAHYNPIIYIYIFSMFGVIRPHSVSVALRVVLILGQKSDFYTPKFASACLVCTWAAAMQSSRYSYCGRCGWRVGQTFCGEQGRSDSRSQ